jgi:multimeric flavodoxin WrbA
MKVAVVHGQAHKGSTYHLTHMLLDKLKCKNEEVTELYVNGIDDCIGCFNCIIKEETTCPHRSQIEEIILAIEEADVIIIASPTYVFGMSGQLKTLFDHMGYRWMSHRPHPAMKNKIGIAISSAAGAGANKTTKQIALQMFWWSVGKIYQLPLTVSAMGWHEVSDKKKAKAEKSTAKIADSILKKVRCVKPSIKSKFMFFIMKQMQKGMGYNQVDVKHWKDNGWIR